MMRMGGCSGPVERVGEPAGELADGQAVVLVHGLWMNGLELLPLGRRLARRGFRPRRFPYRELACTPRENAGRLQHWLTGVPERQVHFVAHSLGGILLLHLFRQYPRQRPGRVVLLGSPVAGSVAARRLAALPLLRHSLGHSLEAGLAGGAPVPEGVAAWGLLAGSLPLGLGRLLGGLPRPHDGTVAVAETRLPGAPAPRVLPVSHFGLLWSPAVAAQVGAFLEYGAFPDAAP
jgi:pimeloyl-ACP methyl ester carboxylesterase